MVPGEVVEAALRAARKRDVPVADVPLIAVAEEAGISRSTLLRRLGGSRAALDEAVRATGIDPGGQRPVRERAIEATARLLGSSGLGSVTLERVAEGAMCSVHSLYATFGGRDALLRAVYDRYSPDVDLDAALASPRDDLTTTVRAIFRALADSLRREPRVLPAIIAEALARPHDPAAQAVYQQSIGRMLEKISGWIAEEAAAGRIRDLPLFPLVQQMTGPVISYFLLTPVYEQFVGLPHPDDAIETFTETFLRAAATSPPTP
ncbi:TetR/AcrR family transcriptional regulator [Streptomyces griseofuscus]|uniref:TetR/AcrR family transcriptional regulator n=1 Tax=Streptomyces griseofuscus TaxID=146922 RepID=UPI0033E21EBF